MSDEPRREEELVVLVDPAGNAVGSAPKLSTHHGHTPLHLAFSCYVFDGDGQLLVTQRSHHKPTFPGLWSNSLCGHPAPGEDVFAAVQRRGRQELGLELRSLRPVLPSFRYAATSASGVVENELCPVFIALTDSDVRPNELEVAAFEWVPWRRFRDEVLAGVRPVSPWCVLQVAELAGRELPGGGFPVAGASDLPPAARRRPPGPP